MTNARKETIVTVRKHGEKIEQHNAAKDAPVSPSEFNAASAGQAAINAKLCMNLLAGRVHKDVKAAAKETGGLNKLLPDASQADKNAIRTCLGDKVTPAQLRKVWQAHVDSKKRVHGVTLQALAKGLKGKPEQRAVPFKDQYAQAWAELFQKDKALAVDPRLERLYQLAIDAGWENPDEANMSV